MKTNLPLNSSERGEGQVGSIVMLVVLIALAVAAANVGPVYWANYQFQDQMTDLAGKFPPNKDGDVRAKAALPRAIEDAGLSEYLDADDCTVTSDGGIGGLRTIACTYTREYKLFGSRKSVTFENEVSRPMF